MPIIIMSLLANHKELPEFFPVVHEFLRRFSMEFQVEFMEKVIGQALPEIMRTDSDAASNLPEFDTWLPSIQQIISNLDKTSYGRLNDIIKVLRKKDTIELWNFMNLVTIGLSAGDKEPDNFIKDSFIRRSIIALLMSPEKLEEIAPGMETIFTRFSEEFHKELMSKIFFIARKGEDRCSKSLCMAQRTAKYYFKIFRHGEEEFYTSYQLCERTAERQRV